jgi:hypothetical protein
MVYKRPSGCCVNHGLQPAKLLMERVLISGNRFWSLLNWERTGKTLSTSPILNTSTLGFSHLTCCSVVMEIVIISDNRFWYLLNSERTGKTLSTSPMLNMSTLGFSQPTCRYVVMEIVIISGNRFWSLRIGNALVKRLRQAPCWTCLHSGLVTLLAVLQDVWHNSLVTLGANGG